MLYTPHFTLDTPHSTLSTWHSTLYTSHSELVRGVGCGVSSVECGVKVYVECGVQNIQGRVSRLYTLHALHFTVHTLCTLHFTLSHYVTLHPHTYTLFTLYAVWNLGLASFSCCAGVLSSYASKGPLRCWRWTFESSPITCHYVGCAEFLHPLRTTVHNQMFSSLSPPTYIASTRWFGCSPHLTCPSFRPARPCWRVLTKKLRSCAVPFVFSCQSPSQASFRPLPLGLKSRCPKPMIWLLPMIGWVWPSKTIDFNKIWPFGI